MIADAAALAVAGQGKTAALLGLLEHFHDEDSFHVWSQIMASLGKIRSVFADNAVVADGLKKFTLKLVAPATENIGWEFKNDDFLEGQTRALLIAAAGGAGHTKYIPPWLSSMEGIS